MRYFPILQELFQSDSAIFLLVGFVFGTVMGLGLRAPGKRALGAGVSLFLYAVCEIVCNLRGSYLTELVALFVGTAALGSLLGFVGCLALARKKGRDAGR